MQPIRTGELLRTGTNGQGAVLAILKGYLEIMSKFLTTWLHFLALTFPIKLSYTAARKREKKEEKKKVS